MGIERAKRDRWILGVCGGIAHTYGWNPNVVRLLTAVVAILPGVTLPIVVVAYILLGIFLPETDEY